MSLSTDRPARKFSYASCLRWDSGQLCQYGEDVMGWPTMEMGFVGRDVKRTIHINLATRLGQYGVIPPFHICFHDVLF